MAGDVGSACEEGDEGEAAGRGGRGDMAVEDALCEGAEEGRRAGEGGEGVFWESVGDGEEEFGWEGVHGHGCWLHRPGLFITRARCDVTALAGNTHVCPATGPAAGLALSQRCVPPPPPNLPSFPPAPFPVRTHACGELTAAHAGTTVVLAGWLLPERCVSYRPPMPQLMAHPNQAKYPTRSHSSPSKTLLGQHSSSSAGTSTMHSLHPCHMSLSNHPC